MIFRRPKHDDEQPTKCKLQIWGRMVILVEVEYPSNLPQEIFSVPRHTGGSTG